MRSVGDLRLPGLDPGDPELKGRRWHRTAGDLIESGHWLARSPQAVIVLDREAGEFFLRSRSAVSPGRSREENPGVGPGPLHDEIEGSILNREGESHHRLRGLVSPSFSPRAVNRWRPAVRQILDGLWVDLPGERFDFVSALGRPLPVLTMARVLDVSSADAPRLNEWSRWARRQLDPVSLSDPEDGAAGQVKLTEFRDWIDPLIADRRDDPGEDLISSLIRTEEEGERLTDEEVRSLVLNLLAGGVESTQAQLAHGIRLLAGAPEHWEALRRDPEGLVPPAVSEILRFEPAVPFTARRLIEDLEYRDVHFPAGTVLMICSFTGNRDRAGFERSGEFDPGLERGGTRPLTFGAGIHYCVGVSLARAELEEALRFLVERVEQIELADEPELEPVNGIYGTESLFIRIHPAA
ncbi:MAG: cytochrome P450 [Solirubrobacterales bacterium]|nr:cytochrome P450 [Solirubrobacterales bacterium]